MPDLATALRAVLPPGVALGLPAAGDLPLADALAIPTLQTFTLE